MSSMSSLSISLCMNAEDPFATATAPELSPPPSPPPFPPPATIEITTLANACYINSAHSVPNIFIRYPRASSSKTSTPVHLMHMHGMPASEVNGSSISHRQPVIFEAAAPSEVYGNAHFYHNENHGRMQSAGTTHPATSSSSFIPQTYDAHGLETSPLSCSNTYSLYRRQLSHYHQKNQIQYWPHVEHYQMQNSYTSTFNSSTPVCNDQQQNLIPRTDLSAIDYSISDKIYYSTSKNPSSSATPKSATYIPTQLPPRQPEQHFHSSEYQHNVFHSPSEHPEALKSHGIRLAAYGTECFEVTL